MTRVHRGIKDVMEWGEVPPEGWYHVRIKKAKDHDPETGEPILSDTNNPKCQLQLAIQEEPFVGTLIFDEPSLQPHALAKLKAYYTATGKGIADDGSDDPEELVDGECYVLIKHEVYNGQTRGKIPPYGIKSLADGKPAA